MTNPKCQICMTRNKRDSEALIEGSHWSVTLNPNQGYLGTLFIELMEHKESLADLSDEEWLSLGRLARRIEAAEKQAFGAMMFNWSCLMNDFYKSTLPVPHVHWHVRPRYAHEVQVGDLAYVDPNFGHHYDKKHVLFLDDLAKKMIFERLRIELNA